MLWSYLISQETCEMKFHTRTGLVTIAMEYNEPYLLAAVDLAEFLHMLFNIENAWGCRKEVLTNRSKQTAGINMQRLNVHLHLAEQN